ncbi:uncharacterized protein LOC144452202 [Glandiceps talaboti]
MERPFLRTEHGEFHSSSEGAESIELQVGYQDMEYEVPAAMSRPMTQQPVRSNIPTMFSDSMYDPTSKAVLDGTYVHMSRGTLNNLISQQTSEMYRSNVAAFTGMHDNLSYDNLLAGLLYRGETLLVNNQYIYYSFVSFMDEHGNATSKAPMRQGRAFLTNQRLLMLSAESSAGATLNKFGDPKKLPGGYRVETSCYDTLHYISVPISCFRSVELYASVGVKAATNIHGQQPCCYGLCGVFGMDMCLKHWTVDSTQGQAHNDRYITMGVIMPPWGTRSYLQMYLNPSVSLTTTKDFISDLQRHAPGLHDKVLDGGASGGGGGGDGKM